LNVDTPGTWQGWQGRTLTKFNAKNENWHYAWQDNRGSYCDFISQFANQVFSLQFVDASGKRIKQRMIIRSFSLERLSWECERYEGQTWQKSWRVEYRRD